jgi:hypothetical protein
LAGNNLYIGFVIQFVTQPAGSGRPQEDGNYEENAGAVYGVVLLTGMMLAPAATAASEASANTPIDTLPARS